MFHAGKIVSPGLRSYFRLLSRHALLHPRARDAACQTSNENPIHEFALPAITRVLRVDDIERK